MSVNFTKFSVSITFYGDSYYILRCQILCYYYILRNYYILRFLLHFALFLHFALLHFVLLVHFALLLHFAVIVSHFAFFVTFRCNKS